MATYRITDSEAPADITVINAADREEAQEIYLDRREAAGTTTGTLRIVRVN